MHRVSAALATLHGRRKAGPPERAQEPDHRPGARLEQVGWWGPPLPAINAAQSQGVSSGSFVGGVIRSTFTSPVSGYILPSTRVPGSRVVWAEGSLTSEGARHVSMPSYGRSWQAIWKRLVHPAHVLALATSVPLSAHIFKYIYDPFLGKGFVVKIGLENKFIDLGLKM